MDKPFQRLGATSNSQVGKDFELLAQSFFQSKEGLILDRGLKIDVGIEDISTLIIFINQY